MAKTPFVNAGRLLPNRYDDPAYFEALGRFVQEFSRVEETIFTFIHEYSKLEIGMAKAILSGVRIEQGISYIRRMMEVRAPSSERKIELNDALTQLHIINNVRNDILHFGVLSLEGIGHVMSNLTRAHTPERRRQLTISAYLLNSLTKDLQKINQHLITQMYYPRMSLRKRAALVPALSDAWLYKPQPANVAARDRPAKQSKSRARRHRASPT